METTALDETNYTGNIKAGSEMSEGKSVAIIRAEYLTFSWRT
jgi:hypothetical protein